MAGARWCRAVYVASEEYSDRWVARTAGPEDGSTHAGSAWSGRRGGGSGEGQGSGLVLVLVIELGAVQSKTVREKAKDLSISRRRAAEPADAVAS